MKQLWKQLTNPPLYLAIPLLVSFFCIVYIVINAIISIDTDREHVIQLELKSLEEKAELISRFGLLVDSAQEEIFTQGVSNFPVDPTIQHLVFAKADGTVMMSHPQAQDPDIVEGKVPPTHREEFFRAIQNQEVVQGIEPGMHAYVVYPSRDLDKSPWTVLLERDISEDLTLATHRTIKEATRASLINLAACAILCYMLHQYLSLRISRIIENSIFLKRFTKEKSANFRGDEFDKVSSLIRESEERLAKISESITDVFYVISGHFDRIYYASPSYREVWGPDIFDRKVFPSGNLLDLVIPEDLAMVMANVERVHRGGLLFEAEFRARWNNTDEIRWFYTRSFPIKGENGELEYLIGFTRDISEQKRLEEEVLNISENERRNIGHDLHDDLCQRLAAIRLKSEILAEKLHRKEAPEAMTATDISQKIGDAVELCRNLALGLSPVNIEQEGLMHSLEILAESSTLMYQIPCRFECPEIILIRNNASATHLYRITQELISNAARHAKPTYIHIRLLNEGGRVRLEVEHDGLFFSPNPGGGQSGMGLHILRYRAKALGTNLRFEPLPNGKVGTLVTCLVSAQFC